MKSWIWGTCL